jgi:hypothetical protein
MSIQLSCLRILSSRGRLWTQKTFAFHKWGAFLNWLSLCQLIEKVHSVCKYILSYWKLCSGSMMILASFLLILTSHVDCQLIFTRNNELCRSQWPRGLRRGSAAVRLLVLWVRIPPGTWMSVSCECCVLSGRGLCDGMTTRPEESYRVWCVWVWSRSLHNEEARAH